MVSAGELGSSVLKPWGVKVEAVDVGGRCRTDPPLKRNCPPDATAPWEAAQPESFASRGDYHPPDSAVGRTGRADGRAGTTKGT